MVQAQHSELDYHTQILSHPDFHIGDHEFSAHQIVQVLEPYLTAARTEKINQVIEQRTRNIAVVVEGLYDIGNISAVMRSAESFGYLPFHIIEKVGAKYKKSKRISRGTEKWLDIRRHQGSDSGIEALRRDGFKIYATDLQATTSIDAIDWTQKSAIVFGSEHEGISESMRAAADETFLLPMYGFAQSFNISVAAALCFSEIQRQRMSKGMPGDLSEIEKSILKAHYYLRTLDSAESILQRTLVDF